MTDKELQSYLKRRLSEYQVSDLPDFDSFFSPEELRPEPVPMPRPKKTWWPWLTAVSAVAAAIALLLIFASPSDETTAPLLSQEAAFSDSILSSDFVARAEDLSSSRNERSSALSLETVAEVKSDAEVVSEAKTSSGISSEVEVVAEIEVKTKLGTVAKVESLSEVAAETEALMRIGSHPSVDESVLADLLAVSDEDLLSEDVMETRFGYSSTSVNKSADLLAVSDEELLSEDVMETQFGYSSTSVNKSADLLAASDEEDPSEEAYLDDLMTPIYIGSTKPMPKRGSYDEENFKLEQHPGGFTGKIQYQLQLPRKEEFVYERSIEEAYADARRQKKKSKKRSLAYGLSFSQNNGLLASASPLNQNTVMNMSPVTGITRQNASVSLRSASLENEWKVPENLSVGQMKSYTPTFHYPITFGLTVDIPLTRLFSLQTGLTYTYLLSEIQGNQENATSWTLDQSLHYLGLPLSLAVDIVNHRSWRVYAAAGGGLEKALCALQHSELRNSLTGEYSTANTTQSVSGVQPYAAASFGLAYTFASRWQVYFQPALNYYFDTNQPMSIRTKKPFSLNLGAGFRFVL
ncbi:MAG: outer membrane beta-barrel protein [Bacteroidales bacterium]|nr:outer membrane beta-barrel protein [Bacteroidales bacterium]